MQFFILPKNSDSPTEKIDPPHHKTSFQNKNISDLLQQILFQTFISPHP